VVFLKRFSARDLIFYLLAILVMVFTFNAVQQMNEPDDPTYNEIRLLFEQEKVKYFSVEDNVLTLTLRGEGEDTSTLKYHLADFNVFYNDLHELIDSQRQAGIIQDYDYPAGWAEPWWFVYVPYLVILLGFGILMYTMYLRQNTGGGGGGGPSRFGHARTRTLADQGKKVTFNDVAGADEEKEELEEIVEFLRDPQKFTALGARIPKGVLLVGPPGTGKTLIAKAVAGEAGVHFLSISGSDFVELYVGVGASRVRDLFDQAKKDAPAIVFIDEIDAVGRQRGAGLGGGHDEREQTLNQLLVEMDGFGSNEGVIVMAATNRPDILDPALLRPGRFDRQIYVGLPDIKGREEILKVHARKKPLAEDVSLSDVAKATSGFTGADLENLLNEAALLSAREDRRFITRQDLHEAMMKVIAGPEKRSRVVTPHARRLTAYHEAGHATVSWILENASPLIKVTIIPRGKALGAAWYLPEERQITTREQMMDELAATLGGRVSEQLTFGEISTGALNDLERVTKQAYAMVAYYGMSENVGTLSYYDSTGQSDMAFTKPYSELTAQQIDAEAKLVIGKAYEMAQKVLREHADGLKELAELLLEREVVFTEDVERIFGRRKKDILREQKEAEAKAKADGAAVKGEPEAPAAPAAKPAPEEAAPAVAQTETPEAPADGNTTAAISKTE